MKGHHIGRAVAIASMLISAGLAVAKITIGLHGHSTAVVSDGIESAGDVLASGLVLLGLIVAAKPPDAEHPYGHGRLETVSALVVGMLLVASGALIAFESLHLATPTEQAPAAYAIWPLIASIVIKGATSMTKRHYGRKIRSSGLAADAWHDAVDVLSGVTALTGLSITLVSPVRFALADHMGGSAVGLIIILLGVGVVRDTMLQLMDTMPDPEALREVRAAALGVPGALGIEKCFARKTGLQWHVDLHLEVDPGMSVYDSHEIATQVRDRVKAQLDWVADVLVHVEPHGLATISTRTHGES
ncbi:MAG TPA: cation diffusion facilitator family transporter [Bryobacteraceae bacterium]|nr:cation diffusion facilitator family transporter [Bryobacteraceae bacterium]HUO31868.1 cation diffusion facilitator family transporter [Bryobacteraceae bacterium]